MVPAPYRWLLACALMLAAGLANAQTDSAAARKEYDSLRKYEGTLKKINETGIVRVGHRQNSVPFAFVDPNGKPVGYALDLCAFVVEAIERELGKELKIELVPVTPENRFDMARAVSNALVSNWKSNTSILSSKRGLEESGLYPVIAPVITCKFWTP